MAVKTKKITSVSSIDNEEIPALPFKLKIMNRTNIIKCFRDGEAHTVSEVSALTGISKITTMRAVHFFCEKGVLATQGKVYQNNTGGKYPEIFKLNIKKYILDITLWSEIVCFTLMDFCGNVVKRSEHPEIEIHKTSFGEIQGFLRRETEYLLNEACIPKEQVYGVWMSTAGMVDYPSMRIKYNAQAAGWGEDVPILESLKQFFGEEPYYFLENGIKTVARALLRQSEVRNQRVLIFSTTCGIAGCFIEHGRILSGKTSLIGEVGHMILDANDWERCNCGSYGCLERMVDIGRIRLALKGQDFPENFQGSALTWEEITITELFALANQGNMAAREQVAYLADCFALALRNISLVFDPELVCFVGDYAEAGEYFDECLKKKLKEFKYYANDKLFKIMYEKGSMAEMDYVGAAAAVADHFFNNDKLYEEE